MRTVKFMDVGRNKATWEASTKSLTASWMFTQLRKHLASRDIEFDEPDKNGTGNIYAGWRNVGSYKVGEEM